MVAPTAGLVHSGDALRSGVGEDVRSVDPGDRVLAPFVVSCGRCEFCRKGLHTSCVNGDYWSGAQAEYVYASEADGTLVRVPDRHADDESTLQALLPLTDVMGTGHHAAVSAGVCAGDTAVVIGDGAVGLCAVLAARRLGAERIVAMGHHEDRLELAEAFGATETVAERGDEAVERARELTYGGGNHVLECVGAASAMETAIGVCRPGGTIGYVGVPYGVDESGLDVFSLFSDNITLRGGVAPVRAYAEALMADVLGGTLDPSPIFTERRVLAGDSLHVYGGVESAPAGEWGSDLVDAMLTDSGTDLVVSDTTERGTAWRMARWPLFWVLAGVALLAAGGWWLLTMGSLLL